MPKRVHDLRSKTFSVAPAKKYLWLSLGENVLAVEQEGTWILTYGAVQSLASSRVQNNRVSLEAFTAHRSHDCSTLRSFSISRSDV